MKSLNFDFQKLGEQKKDSPATSSIRSSPDLLTPKDSVATPQTARESGPNAVTEIDESMTPPLSIRATSIPGEDLLEPGRQDEMNQNSAAKAAPKKNEWDMFAEQDLASNFDVSKFKKTVISCD